MQVLTYDYPVDIRKRKQLQKHRSHHEKYIRQYLSKSDSKLNLHMIQSMNKLEKTRGFLVHMSIYFDHATEKDLEEFAKNDPWIKHQFIQNWKSKSDILVFDPIEMIQNNENGPFTFEF